MNKNIKVKRKLSDYLEDSYIKQKKNINLKIDQNIQNDNENKNVNENEISKIPI